MNFGGDLHPTVSAILLGSYSRRKKLESSSILPNKSGFQICEFPKFSNSCCAVSLNKYLYFLRETIIQINANITFV